MQDPSQQSCHYCGKPTLMRAYEVDLPRPGADGKDVPVAHVYPPCCGQCVQKESVDWGPIPSSACSPELLELARRQPKCENPFLARPLEYDAVRGGNSMLNAQDIISLMVDRYRQKTSQMLLLNTGHVSELLGVSEATVKRWADAGRIPSNRTVGHHRKFRPDDVATFLNSEPKILERLYKDMVANAPEAPPPADVAQGEAFGMADNSQASPLPVGPLTGASEPLQVNANGRVLLDPRNVLVRMPDGSVQTPVVTSDERVVVSLDGRNYELFSAEVG